MARTPEEQAAWEQQCYGCSEAEHRAGIDHLVEQYFGNVNMSLGSILSDVQELIDVARLGPAPGLEPPLEQARQYLNRVKSAIFNAGPIQLWQRDDTAA